MFAKLRKTRSCIAVFVALSVFAVAQTVMACPTCKDGLADDPNAQTLVNGYFWSIVFMMAMPFLVFGGLATYFYLEIRKARKLAVHANSDNRLLADGES